MPRSRAWTIVAGLSGLVGVMAAAAAAHGIADPHLAKTTETAAWLQLVHAAVLLWLTTADSRALRWARGLMLLGTVLFCGTLYLKAFGIGAAISGVVPVGGTSVMLAWLMIALDGGLRRGGD
ncbi:MAG TPA: DUF423 domain-containing protein [Candidatus Sulfotelmatobacter sp.]|nr:DUF423 domain-containing protein [Candidatus Sulfotelmatobacter sp.]